MAASSTSRTAGTSGGLLSPLETLPEPAADLAAQLAAVADPASAKRAMFLAQGSPLPASLPPGVTAATRPEGTLLTSDPERAREFQRSAALTDDGMARLLGYPESKRAAIAADGAPVAVQATAPGGGVVHAGLASQAGIPAAVRAARAAAPGGRVTIQTPQAAVLRRLRGLLGELGR
jgi:hypothetical protein